MLKRLRIKFVCINMVIVTVMLAVIFGMVLSFTQANLEQESLRMMQTVAMAPVALGRPGERTEEIRLPHFILQVDHRGELISAQGGYYDLSDEVFLREVMSSALSSAEQAGVITGYNLRFFRMANPNGQLLVFADISSERNTMENLLKSCLLIGGISFVVFLFISLLLAYWAVKPVDKAWTQQRQFVADASHELKTPLTVIMTNAELLQEPGYDEASRTQFSSSILTMSHQMRGLVESLLELTRVDNGMVKAAMTSVDLSGLISDAVLPFEPLYFEKGLGLRYQIEEGIGVKGSESHLRQVIDILLDNAMKYAAPCAEVKVDLKKQGAHCVLSVSNPGEPITREDLKNIFKRFYRIDKARSMNHSYGLGLSIAEGIVREHRGKIWAESGEGVNTFRVQLPMAL